MPFSILILDDEPISLKFMTKILESYLSEQVQLFPCSASTQALDLLATRTIDIALSDIKMPDIDGITLLSKFRKAGANTFFIMVSAFANKQIAVESLRLGAFDFVEKPVQKDQLISSVKRALEQIRLTRDLNEAQAKSIESERLASLGLMAGNIAHEISTPLTIMNSLIEEYFREPEIFDLALAMKQFRSMNDRVSKIVKSLKNLAWAGESSEPEMVPVSTILDDIVNLSSLQLKHKKITLDVQAPVENSLIFCERISLSQVLLNLVNNAIDAVEALPKKWIKIRIQKEGENTIFSVIDAGKGIDESLHTKIFEPFFTTKKMGRGVGLGLSNALRVVSYLGGTLTIDKQNPNTSFVISLPTDPPKLSSTTPRI